MNTGLTSGLVACAIVLGITTPAKAAVVFADDFNRSNGPNSSVGNGWVETEDPAQPERIRLDSGMLIMQHGYVMPVLEQPGISTTGLSQIVLSYRWKLTTGAHQYSDTLGVRIFTPLARIEVARHGIYGAFQWTNEVFALPVDAEDAVIALNFILESYYSDAAVAIDDVCITGIPEPATLSLLALGALVARKRRRE